MTLELLIKSGWLPDPILRAGIRALLAQRLRRERGRADAGSLARLMRQRPIAEHAREANQQHYEVPTEFYRLMLGPHLKYSSGWWEDGAADLASAEAAMLGLCCQRARLSDGQRILELGCGWGSLALWMAQRYPRSRVVALSNSSTQREHVLEQCARRGLSNLEVVTCNVQDFQPEGVFDRVVSVEMFEHLRNWERLLERIAGWLVPTGSLFVHIFAHRCLAYEFDPQGATNWMARKFFTGGLMPSEDLLLEFDRDLQVVERWRVNGQNYGRTAEAWLANLDMSSTRAREVLRASGGGAGLEEWRVFLMACAELWNYSAGEEWVVAHYRLQPRGAASGVAA